MLSKYMSVRLVYQHPEDRKSVTLPTALWKTILSTLWRRPIFRYNAITFTTQ